MDKSILFKSFINVLLTWLIFALIINWTKHTGFAAALLKPQIIIIAIAAGAGSYIGFMRKKS